MKFFFGDARGYAVEYSIVDPVEQTLTLKLVMTYDLFVKDINLNDMNIYKCVIT